MGRELEKERGNNQDGSRKFVIWDLGIVRHEMFQIYVDGDFYVILICVDDDFYVIMISINLINLGNCR